MRAEELRDLLRLRPFRPLRLHLTDGKTFDIRHPEMALLTRSTVELGTETEPGSGIAESFHYVSLVHIVRVEFLDAKTRPVEVN